MICLYLFLLNVWFCYLACMCEYYSCISVSLDLNIGLATKPRSLGQRMPAVRLLCLKHVYQFFVQLSALIWLYTSWACLQIWCWNFLHHFCVQLELYPWRAKLDIVHLVHGEAFISESRAISFSRHNIPALSTTHETHRTVLPPTECVSIQNGPPAIW